MLTRCSQLIFLSLHFYLVDVVSHDKEVFSGTAELFFNQVWVGISNDRGLDETIT